MLEWIDAWMNKKFEKLKKYLIGTNKICLGSALDGKF